MFQSTRASIEARDDADVHDVQSQASSFNPRAPRSRRATLTYGADMRRRHVSIHARLDRGARRCSRRVFIRAREARTRVWSFNPRAPRSRRATTALVTRHPDWRLGVSIHARLDRGARPGAWRTCVPQLFQSTRASIEARDAIADFHDSVMNMVSIHARLDRGARRNCTQAIAGVMQSFQSTRASIEARDDVLGLAGLIGVSIHARLDRGARLLAHN